METPVPSTRKTGRPAYGPIAVGLKKAAEPAGLDDVRALAIITKRRRRFLQPGQVLAEELANPYNRRRIEDLFDGLVWAVIGENAMRELFIQIKPLAEGGVNLALGPCVQRPKADGCAFAVGPIDVGDQASVFHSQRAWLPAAPHVAPADGRDFCRPFSIPDRLMGKGSPQYRRSILAFVRDSTRSSEIRREAVAGRIHRKAIQ
ncbi:MAG: hypothetical protein ACLFV7_05755 [Phycisphaerae bacterium]